MARRKFFQKEIPANHFGLGHYLPAVTVVAHGFGDTQNSDKYTKSASCCVPRCTTPHGQVLASGSFNSHPHHPQCRI